MCNCMYSSEARSSAVISNCERGMQVKYSPCQEALHTRQNANEQSSQIARRSAGAGSGGAESSVSEPFEG